MAVPGVLRLAAPSALALARLRLAGARCGVVTCEGRPPRVRGGGRITIGSRLALRGYPLPVELGAVPGAALEIGDRVFVNGGATLVAHVGIRIGSDVRIGDLVAIYDTDHHPLDEVRQVGRRSIAIGDNAWIGRGAIVLADVGEHAVVAAGSVVTRAVAARTLVAGNPARAVHELTASAGWRRP
jgi:acetyltransferase-like isoleucine patch superfamily enzyme